MKPTNYFKVRAAGCEQTFAFETWERRSIRAAFGRAAAFARSTRGRLSVFAGVPLSGPWDGVPVIVPEAGLPVWRVPAPAPASRMALFGEGGCF